MLYYYLCAIFTLISAAVSFGFSVEALVKSKNDALTIAKYAISRSLSILLVSVGALIFISETYLIVVSAIMICVQLFDGIVGIKISVFKTVAPILTAVGNIVFLMLLFIN